MSNRDEYLPDDLFEVAEQLRNHRHEPTELRLDELRRQALARSTASFGPWQGRKFLLKSKIVTLGLMLGLLVCGGGAGVIATSHAPPPHASNPQYLCDSGGGNGFEEDGPGPGNQQEQGQDGTQTSADCDPGNSPTHNRDNDREGPPNDRGPNTRGKR